MRFARHRIVYLDEARWPMIVANYPEVKMPEVARWVASGRPLISRRAVCGDAAGQIPLGLPLPPSLGRARLSFVVSPEAIVSDRPAPLLADMIEIAPVEWRRTIAAIVGTRVDTRCFGSLAWEFLTGLPYLSRTSDLDLLWQVADEESAAKLTASLTAIQADAPMELDGEIITPRGFAVQWQEWALSAPEVLAKAADGNRMIARGMVFT